MEAGTIQWFVKNKESSRNPWNFSIVFEDTIR